MFKKILLIVAVIIAVALIWLALTDGSYDVKRSTVIEADQTEVYDVIADLGSWTTWSPWLIMEPDAEVIVSGEAGAVGNFYSWKGTLVGAGEMENMEVSRPTSILQEIRFTDPFPSSSSVYWNVEKIGSDTKVTWGMKGEMPFLFKFMAKQMEPMIGMDYERGLRMLKEYIETGRILSEVKVDGTKELPGFKYIGIQSTVSMDEIGDVMGQNYAKIMAFMQENGLKESAQPISIYSDFGPGKKEITFTAAIPYVGEAEVPSDFETGEYPAESVFVVTHLGRYEHVGNAWSTAFSATRYKKIKVNGKLDPYEVYVNDPMSEPDEAKWKTQIVLPLK